MNPNELIDKLNICVAALTKGNIQLKTLGLKKAESERVYRVALAKKIFNLKIIRKYLKDSEICLLSSSSRI